MEPRRVILVFLIVCVATMGAAWAAPSIAAAKDRDPLTGRPLRGQRAKLARAAATPPVPKPPPPPLAVPPSSAAAGEPAPTRPEGSGSATPAAEPLPRDPLAEQYVGDVIARQRVQVETQLWPQVAARMEREAQRVVQSGRVAPPGALAGQLAAAGSTAAAPAVAAPAIADPVARQAVATLLKTNGQPVLDELAALEAGLQQQTETLRSRWIAVRTELDHEQELSFEVEGNHRVAGQLATLLSFDNRWFWACGLLAVATLTAVACYDRRREIRRMLHGGRATAIGLMAALVGLLGLLALPTVMIFISGNRMYEAMVSQAGAGDAPRQRHEKANTELAAALTAMEPAHQASRTRYELAETALTAAEQKTAAAGLEPSGAQLRGRAVAVAIAAAVLNALPAAAAEDAKALDEARQQRARQTASAGWALRLRPLLRGGCGLLILAISGLGGLLFWQGRRRREEADSQTCPLCLAQGALENDAEAPPGPSGLPAVTMIRCHNLINQHPPERCDYCFAATYQPLPKLCFPTLGVPQAGKTHWLAMVYWWLNRGNYPRALQFERVKSRGSEDFDLIVEDVLTSRIGTAASQGEHIPRPVVFNLRDRDPLGRGNLLMNVFDYSGEVTSALGVEDFRRRRALEADGYLFFLDPTYPSGPQTKALVDFREDLRTIKGLAAGRRVRTPIALCVSKIDLLANQSYALPGGGDNIARFYEELATIDPSGEALSLGVLQARSRLVSQLRDTIWPGWQIERQVQELFGSRYLFFPLTPVGLDGRGETDLSLRTISPFGLLEPLMWLLEMNGYRVLD